MLFSILNANLRVLLIAGLLSSVACKREAIKAPTRSKSKVGNGVESQNSEPKDSIDPDYIIGREGADKSKADPKKESDKDSNSQDTDKNDNKKDEVSPGVSPDKEEKESESAESNQPKEKQEEEINDQTPEKEITDNQEEVKSQKLTLSIDESLLYQKRDKAPVRLVWKKIDKGWKDYIPYLGGKEKLVLEKVFIGYDDDKVELAIENEEPIYATVQKEEVFLEEKIIGRLKSKKGEDAEFSVHYFFQQPLISGTTIRFHNNTLEDNLSQLDNDSSVEFKISKITVADKEAIKEDTNLDGEPKGSAYLYRIRVIVFNQKSLEDDYADRVAVANVPITLEKQREESIVFSAKALNDVLDYLDYKEFPYYGINLVLQRSKIFGGFKDLRAYRLYLGGGDKGPINLPFYSDELEKNTNDEFNDSQNSMIFTIKLKD